MILMQYILIGIASIGIVNLLRQLGQKKINVSNSIKWFLLWGVIIVVAIDPDSTTKVANFFGIGRGVDFMMYAAFIFIFFLIFKLLLRINQLDKNITKIVNHLAVKDSKNNKQENNELS